MTKICIVSPSLKMGGIARVLSELANYWVNNGYEVCFISCLAGNRLYNLDEKVDFVEPDFYRSTSSANKLLFYPRLLLFIRKHVIRYNPDRVLTFGDTFNPLVILSLRFTNFKIFISDRTSPEYKYTFPNSSLKKRLYPKADGFIAQTQKMKKHRQQEYPGLNIEVIPNPLKNLQTKEVERKPIILYVGRFAIEKGPERLIHAFSKLKKAPEWELYMAGEGPMLEEMKEIAIELGIEDRVKFLGRVDNVAQLYSKASIFVLPSRLEGFPNALCEAMSYGLPCVTFDSIPYQEIYEDEVSGKAIPEGDTNSLAAYIQELIDNDNLRKEMGRNAKKEIGKLDIANIANRFSEFMNI